MLLEFNYKNGKLEMYEFGNLMYWDYNSLRPPISLSVQQYICLHHASRPSGIFFYINLKGKPHKMLTWIHFHDKFGNEYCSLRNITSPCRELRALTGPGSGSLRLGNIIRTGTFKHALSDQGVQTRLSQFGVWGYAKAKKKVIHNQGLYQAF